MIVTTLMRSLLIGDSSILKPICLCAVELCFCFCAAAAEPQSLDVWPDLAPGETSRETGAALPPRGGEARASTTSAGATMSRRRC